MSHEPPIPAGNQSPYPLQEPPHAHGGEPPADTTVAKTPDPAHGHAPALSRGVIGVLAAGAVAGLAAAGAWAYASRSDAPRPKPRKGKHKKH